MLSKIIVSSYAVFIEISLWLSLLLFVIGGWNFSNPMTGEGGWLHGCNYRFNNMVRDCCSLLWSFFDS